MFHADYHDVATHLASQATSRLRNYILAPIPILLLVQSLGHGGCERDAAKLATGLDRSLFSPHVGVLREGGFRVQEVRDANIPVVHFPVTSFMKPSVLSAAREMGNYARHHRIKVLHSFDVPTDIFGALTARVYRIPCIVTAQLSYRSLVSARERALLRLSDQFSDSIVVNSQAVRDSLIREFRIPSRKIYLCYNGVNSTEFYPAPVPRPDFLSGASVVIGSVCVMRPEKRMDWLVRSFADVRRIDPDARLVLVGSGPEVSSLKKLTETLDIAGQTFFIPGRSDIADWMRLMDVYVNASKSESFPNGLLEAMACGCCAIGSCVGGIPELIQHERTGLTFDSQLNASLTDALTLVLSEPDLRAQLRENAFTTAHSKFSMANTLDRMQSLYLSLVQSHVAASA